MSTRDKIKKLLVENKNRLFGKYNIELLALFGSYSRNDYHRNSDVDIFVEFNQPIGIELIDLADELEEILEKKVDLVTKNGIKPRYYNHISKDFIYV